MAYRPVQYGSAEVGPGYTISGLKETLDMLEGLPKAVHLNGMARALHAGLQVLEDAIEAVTPIRLEEDGGKLIVAGGELKADIYHEVVLDSNYRGGYGWVSWRKLSHVANFIEYGHRMVSHDGRQISGPKTPGGMVRPFAFIRPAFDSSKDKSIDAFAATLAETINRLNAIVA